MKSYSVLKKFFLWHVISIIMLSSSILVFTVRQVKVNYIKNSSEVLHQQVLILKEMLSQDIINKKFEELDKKIKFFAEETNTRIKIVLPDGKVVADSETVPEKVEEYEFSPEITKMFDNKVDLDRGKVTIEKKIIYALIPVIQKEKTIAVIKICVLLPDSQLPPIRTSRNCSLKRA
ncbi:MAG: hypothetical protein SNJ64_03880, partial [Endomicrobiia bacterium]